MNHLANSNHETGVKNLLIRCAESCTGRPHQRDALTDVSGSSDVVDRGFVTYSNDAKEEMLNVQ